MSDLIEIDLAALEAEAAPITAGQCKPMRQKIPIKWIENLRLQNVSAHSVRRNLEGRGTREGQIVSLLWILVHFDETAAIYEAPCPYQFCDGKGSLDAMALIDKNGNAVLPFAAPGSLCCPLCDEAISQIYEAEAAKMAARRKSHSAAT